MDKTRRVYKARENVDNAHKTTGFICLLAAAMCTMLHIASFYCVEQMMMKAQVVDNTINYANMPKEIMLMGVLGYIMAGVAIILFAVGIVYYVRARRRSEPR